MGRADLLPHARALALLETAPLPAPWTPIPPPLPADSLQGPTLYLPLPPGRTPRAYEPTTRLMVQALEQGAWLVNGYSGYIPGFQRQFKVVEERFPDDYSLQLLRDAGIQTLVLEAESLGPDQRRALEAQIARGALPPPQRTAGKLIFRWERPSPRWLQAFSGEWSFTARLAAHGLRLYLSPQVSLPRGYLLAPALRPMRWIVELDGQRVTAEATRAVFFYPESDRSILLKIPWEAPVLPQIRIFDAASKPLPLR